VEEDGGTLVIATGEDFPRELGVDYADLYVEELRAAQALELLAGQDQHFFSELMIVAPAGRVLELRVGALGRSDELLVRVPASFDDYADAYQDYAAPPQGARPYVVRRSLGTAGDKQGQIVVF